MTGFNPLDPGGDYSLDMTLETGRRTMKNVLKKVAIGEVEFDQGRGITLVGQQALLRLKCE